MCMRHNSDYGQVSNLYRVWKKVVILLVIEEDQNLICKLNKIIGEELKYSELCRKLDLPVKTGNSKMAQLSNLENYCDMEIIDNYPTKYKIIHTYPEAITILSGISNNDKFLLILFFDFIILAA